MLFLLLPAFAQEPLVVPSVEASSLARPSPWVAGLAAGGATLGAMVAGSALAATVGGRWPYVTRCGDLTDCTTQSSGIVGVGLLAGVLASGVVPQVEGVSPWIPLAATGSVAVVGTEASILVPLLGGEYRGAAGPGILATVVAMPVVAGIATGLAASDAPSVGLALMPGGVGVEVTGRW